MCSLTTKEIVMPCVWVGRFSPLNASQTTEPSSKRPFETQRGATRNAKIVVLPVVWICRFSDLCTSHATNWSCKTPSYSWVFLVTTRTEVVIVPCIFVSRFLNLYTSKSTYWASKTPAEVIRPSWEPRRS